MVGPSLASDRIAQQSSDLLLFLCNDVSGDGLRHLRNAPLGRKSICAGLNSATRKGLLPSGKVISARAAPEAQQKQIRRGSSRIRVRIDHGHRARLKD